MVDLIVRSGTVLRIDADFKIAPNYAHFRMEANSTILCSVDLLLRADRCEFAENCLIDARGSTGTLGSQSPELPLQSQNGTSGMAGGPGGPGGNGHNVTIVAGLAQIGTLTIIASGGQGGDGGAGQPGSLPLGGHPSGAGGNGGPGERGGDGGQIAVTWGRLAPGLPNSADIPPPGHTYISTGGAAGRGGIGGPSADNLNWPGHPGTNGPNGAAGTGAPPQVRWKTGLTGLLWVQKQDMGPAPRSGHDVAFDLTRERLVLFGGGGLTPLGDTWEWDGRFWVQVADTGPLARRGHGMAFDTISGRVLLFGGRQGDRTPLGDTWAWDGEDWIQLADTGPTPRDGHGMASDPTRSRIVLFGGGLASAVDGAALAGDTWEWNQGQWVQVQDVGPSARTGTKLAYDPGSGLTLLFGGSTDPGTWGWDGSNWKEVADMGPGAREGHAMSTSDGGAILFGGAPPTAPQAAVAAPRGDTWAWFDQSWRQIQDIGPVPRRRHAMAYNPTGTIIAFGGETAEGTFEGDTWELAPHS